MEYKPSIYQEAIYDFAKDGKGNAIVEAVAGSGKTHTLRELTKIIPKTDSIVFFSFNKSIQEELRQKLPKRIRVSTLHSFGRSMFYRNSINHVVDEDKLKILISDRLKEFAKPDKVFEKKEEAMVYKEEQRQMILDKLRENNESKVLLTDYLENVIPKVKQSMCNLTEEEVNTLPNMYQLATPFRLELISDILQKSIDIPQIIDFVDMMYIPVRKQFDSGKYNWVLVDEVQDLSKVQFELIKLVCNEHTRIIAVGDSHQAMYGFRCADIDSMKNFKEYFNAKKLPLSICYRCPKRVVKLAQKIVPHIEYWDKQEDGIVEEISFDEMVKKADNGDMIICRTNAPLVKVAFQLIRMGKKATIKSLNIQKYILNLIKYSNPKDLATLQKITITKLREYESKLDDLKDVEYTRLVHKEKLNLIRQIDRNETLLFFINHAGTLSELKEKINILFSGSSKYITCSTVHKAKGLEADNVFIYRYDLMPHSMAESPREIQEEKNIEYVAITRAKKALYLISDDQKKKY